jgi:copper chaperone CopZ
MRLRRSPSSLLRSTALAALLGACTTIAADPSLGDATPIDSAGAVVTVHGMGCPQCANNLDLQLCALPGVQGVDVDMGSGVVRVTLAGQPPRPSPKQLAEAVRDSGFTPLKVEAR